MKEIKDRVAALITQVMQKEPIAAQMGLQLFVYIDSDIYGFLLDEHNRYIYATDKHCNTLRGHEVIIGSRTGVALWEELKV